MVRLVFRPYTQLRRSICTSESLRSSIRVSPDFNLARHSSPSFGSQRVRSCCSARCEVDAKRRGCAPSQRSPLSYTRQPSLSLRLWASNTQWLAHMLNSLVRVSRRVGGAADLLATEMRAVLTRTLAIRARSSTRHRQSQARGACHGPRGLRQTSSPTTVRHDNGSSREATVECSRPPSRPRRPVLADPKRPSYPTVSLNHRHRLREPLRLLLHSFTYF